MRPQTSGSQKTEGLVGHQKLLGFPVRQDVCRGFSAECCHALTYVLGNHSSSENTRMEAGGKDYLEAWCSHPHKR